MALMGVQANILGDIHFHKYFQFHTDGYAYSSLFRMAKVAIAKLQQNKTNLHAIQTINVLFIDEIGQISNKQLAAIDIIFCQECKSSIPFGSVLINATLDLTQLQPI